MARSSRSSPSPARQNLTELVNRAAYGKERVLLTRRGKAIAAIVPLEDLAGIEEIETQADQKALAEARREVAKHGAVSWEALKRGLRAG